jgi:hypothetical protein
MLAASMLARDRITPTKVLRDAFAVQDITIPRPEVNLKEGREFTASRGNYAASQTYCTLSQLNLLHPYAHGDPGRDDLAPKYPYDPCQ